MQRTPLGMLYLAMNAVSFLPPAGTPKQKPTVLRDEREVWYAQNGRGPVTANTLRDEHAARLSAADAP